MICFCFFVFLKSNHESLVSGLLLSYEDTRGLPLVKKITTFLSPVILFWLDGWLRAKNKIRPTLLSPVKGILRIEAQRFIKQKKKIRSMMMVNVNARVKKWSLRVVGICVCSVYVY